MMKLFCPHCGSKAEYQFSPPNFCSKCGQRYSGVTQQSKKFLLSESKVFKKQPLSETDEEEYDESELDVEGEEVYSDSIRVPRLRNINVEIDMSTDIKVIKMSDLFNGVEKNEQFQFGKRKNLNDRIDERNK